MFMVKVVQMVRTFGCGPNNAGSCPVLHPPTGVNKMKYNTPKNREILAKEAVDQLDLNTMACILKEILENEYASLSTDEFNVAWIQVFGET